MADDNDKDKQQLPPVIAPPSAPPGVLPAAITDAPAPAPAPPTPGVAPPNAQLPAPHEGFLAHLYHQRISAPQPGQPDTRIQNPFLRGLAGVGLGAARAAEGIATPFAPELAFVPGTEANAIAQNNQDVRRFATQAKANQEAAQARAAGENAAANTTKAKTGAETEAREAALQPSVIEKNEAEAANQAHLAKKPFDSNKPLKAYSLPDHPTPIYIPSDQQPPAGAVPYQPTPVQHPVQGMVNAKPAFGIFAGPGKGWIDPNTGAPLPNFTPPPSWAESLLPTHTLTLTDPTTNLPRDYHWQYGANGAITLTPVQIPGAPSSTPAMPGSGAYPKQVQDAGALLRMVNDNVMPLVGKMEKNNEFGIVQGRFSDWLNRDVGNAPPDVAQLHQLMNGVISMMMGMYGFRRQQAVDELAKQMGARMTPESMRASLQGIVQHAQSIIGPVGAGDEGAPPPGSKIRDYTDIH